MTEGMKKYGSTPLSQTFRTAGVAVAGAKAAQLRLAVVGEHQSAQCDWRRSRKQQEDLYRAFLKGLD